MQIIHRLILCCVFLLPDLALAATGQRVALLIGNAKYTSAQLTNPPGDVRHMEAALKKSASKCKPCWMPTRSR